MFIVIGLMLVGVLAGRFLRRFKFGWIQALIIMLIWILLFLLGVDVGSNEQIIREFHTIGMEAIVITLFAVLGSVIAASLFWRRLNKNKKGGAGV